tara:strand:+ start:8395 stop:9168 length:774 start_codon:yes stop_codon:yes gene_type:complete
MNITSFNREKIENGLKSVQPDASESENNIRLIFAPKTIQDDNFENVCKMYSKLGRDDYDTVVVIESHPGSADKKLPMPSFKQLETSLGITLVNDKLRNDFADEDDDFYINDDAFDEDVSIYNQLMMLQSALNKFSILSIQITDESSFIVKELAYAVEEILASRSALIVCCCEMNQNGSEEISRVLDMLNSNNISGIMNYLNNGESTVDGVGTFVAGLLIGKKWNLSFQFPLLNGDNSNIENPLIGTAALQRESIFHG